MNLLLVYILKVVAIQTVLYVLYTLVFHKSGRHQINRVFILSSLVVSFFIPLLQLPTIQSATMVEELQPAEIWFAAVESEMTQVELIPVAKVQENNSVFQYIFGFFLLMIVFFILKLGVQYFQLHNMKKKSKLVKSTWYRLYETSFQGAFSFFHNVYLPKYLFKSQAFEQVLLHECSHVKMRHSIDRVFIECLLAIFWFNPILYWFRKRLIEVHEFQADESVVQSYHDPIQYQETLYSQLIQTPTVAFANHFKLSIIKNRIKMINKTKKYSGWIYSFSLPILMLLVFIFSDKEPISPLGEFTEHVKILVPELDITEDYTPSILPLKNTNNVKITSTYGPRLHPILKVERLHEGVDFSTPVGNPVLATADGVILANEETFQGWGKRILVDHDGLYQTSYAHLSESKVAVGDKVKRGQTIALSGSSGASVGPHLHYEVTDMEKGYVDPVLFISDYDFNLKTNADQPSEKLNKKGKFKVVIDPGHGGADKGTHTSGLDEKDVVWQVAQELLRQFEDSDEIKISLTRLGDQLVSLKDRTAMSKEADLFLSLHIERHQNPEENSLLPVYIDQGELSEASKRFADLLVDEFRASGQNIQAGYSTGYYVLKNAHCPPVLFNIGYASNINSDSYLNSEVGRKEIAQLIADAIKKAAL